MIVQQQQCFKELLSLGTIGALVAIQRSVNVICQPATMKSRLGSIGSCAQFSLLLAEQAALVTVSKGLS